MKIKDLLTRFKKEVVCKPLKEIVNISRGTFINKKEIESNPGKYPVMNTGKTPLGFYNKWNAENDPISISSRGTVGYISWTEGRFFRGDSCISLKVIDETKVFPKYLYYALKASSAQIEKITGGSLIKSLNKSTLEKLTVFIPSLEVQKGMVAILEEAESSCIKLKKSVKQLFYNNNKRLKYHREKLLIPNQDNLKWVKLGEVGEFIRGKSFTKKDFSDKGTPAIHYGQIFTCFNSYTDSAFSLISDEIKVKRKVKPGDILIATTSENERDVCKAVAWLGNYEIILSSDACFYSHNLNPKYVSFFFQTENFLLQKYPYITGTQIKRVNASALEEILIPDLPLEVQEEVANKVDSLFVENENLKRNINAALVIEEKLFRTILSKFFATSDNEPILI